MRIAIMGSGGVGAYFGARLASAGEDVTLIARGAHLAAIRENGLTLYSKLGDASVTSIKATDNPRDVDPVDVILFTVKCYDAAAAAEQMIPMVGPQTMIVPVQNGVTMADDLAPIVGADRAIGGLVFIASFITAPGIVTHMSAVDQLIFGELDGNVSPRVEAFLEVGLKAGFAARASDDITTELWNKFVLIGGFNPVACLSRQPVGPVHSDRDLRALFIRTMEEVAAVGRAKGVALAADIVEKTLAFSERAFSPESKPSMLAGC